MRKRDVIINNLCRIASARKWMSGSF